MHTNEHSRTDARVTRRIFVFLLTTCFNGIRVMRHGAKRDGELDSNIVRRAFVIANRVRIWKFFPISAAAPASLQSYIENNLIDDVSALITKKSTLACNFIKNMAKVEQKILRVEKKISFSLRNISFATFWISRAREIHHYSRTLPRWVLPVPTYSFGREKKNERVVSLNQEFLGKLSQLFTRSRQWANFTICSVRLVKVTADKRL